MSTIFPREEKAEQIFDKILENPEACERLKDTFFEAIPSAEESEGAGTDIPGTVFAAALFHAKIFRHFSWLSAITVCLIFCVILS